MLINELGEEMGERHGWKAEVARRLGVVGSTVTRALNGKRAEISAESVQLAAKGLGISESYFYDDDEPASYHEHRDALLDFFPTKQERQLLEVLLSARGFFETYVRTGRLPAEASGIAARVLSLEIVERARAVTTAPPTASAHRTAELVRTLGSMAITAKSIERAAALERVAEEEGERLDRSTRED